jgi:hypothetical protein
VRKLADVAAEELLWVQPSVRKQAYELRAGTDVVATLTWQRGSLADAEADDHHWTFKRAGFWQPRVTVRVAGSDTDVAIFRPAWMGGGTLELAGGKVLRFSAANFWHSQWNWQEPRTESALVHFKSQQGLLKTGGRVEITPTARTIPELPLLVLLGWYLLILFAQDASAASTAAVVASVG